jgi:hypothetical protein
MRMVHLELTKRPSVRFAASYQPVARFDSLARPSVGSAVMTSSGGRLLERSGAVAVALALLALAGFVILFAGNLSGATELEERAARASASVVVLEELVAAGSRELAFTETAEFVLQQARAIGYGQPGEKPFRLPEGAPSPAPLAWLGDDRDVDEASTPFDDWMALFFGA